MEEKAYIAGPIKNDPDYLSNFLDCQRWLEKNTFWEIFNPAAQVPVLLEKYGMEHTEKNCMAICLFNLMQCDIAVFLPGWEKSKVALIENECARNYELKIYYRMDGGLVKWP